jgi:predicted aspartyl protease
MRQRSAVSDGMYVFGSFNQGKPLELQLDTGASGILISSRAAQAAGIVAVSTSTIFGIGDAGGQKSQTGSAAQFSVGDVTWANAPVEFGDRKLPNSSDGLIGTDVFSAFLIRMSIPAESMDLSPLPPYEDGINDPRQHDRVVPEGLPSALLARRVGHQLLVPVLVNGKSVSYFLVDTGASMNLISAEYARLFTSVGITEMARLKGLSGEIGKLYSALSIRMQFGYFVQEDHGMLALKLNDLDQASGVQVNGILGWPTLSQLVITLNYRDGIVEFVHPSEVKKAR